MSMDSFSLSKKEEDKGLPLGIVSKPWMLAGLELCFAYAYAVASLERGNGEALLFT